MAKKHHIIYLPGLGDPHKSEQTALELLWRIYNVRVHCLTLNWRDNTPFATKLNRVIKLIDKLKSEGHTVSLIGTSAGASAAINAYSQRQEAVSKVVCICGKLDNAQTIAEITFVRNPSFRESLIMLPKSLASLDNTSRDKILSIHPLKDGVVPIADTFIEGARQKTVPTVGHAFSIMYAITFGSFQIAKYIKV